jgi:hypothetical protein
VLVSVNPGVDEQDLRDWARILHGFDMFRPRANGYANGYNGYPHHGGETFNFGSPKYVTGRIVM